ncbi:MAG TPA: DinB family protein [Pyrinomonadaceae bacterium]|nr:DinB family protein [Pyrinomonadaceae bacterium]
MTQTMIDRYRRWFEYEKDSHAKTLASLNEAPADLRESEGYRKAVYLMGHIIAARRVWLYRLGIASEKVDLFRQEISLEELPAELADMETNWSNYLARLNDEGLARVFEYESYEGDRFRNTVEEILTQMFGHSWYHRGQIAQLLRSNGAQPAVTDFVFWCRQPLDEQA